MSEVLCYCPLCDEAIMKGTPMADHHVYKLGELDYIELAHRACAVKFDPGMSYWQFDNPEPLPEDDTAEEEDYQEPDDSDADSQWLASAGMGTDEDYGYYGGED